MIRRRIIMDGVTIRSIALHSITVLVDGLLAEHGTDAHRKKALIASIEWVSLFT